MSRVSLCRVCLASNIRMQNIAQTRYQEIFERLATKLHTDDRRPETLCFVCYSQLQRCCKFMEMSLKAEEILTQFTQSGIELTEGAVNIPEGKFGHKTAWTPLQFLCINDVTGHNLHQVKTEIKTEPNKEAAQVNIKIEVYTDRNQLTEVIREEKTPTHISKKDIKTELYKRDIMKNEGENLTEYDDNEEKVTVSVSKIPMGYENKIENPIDIIIERDITSQYGGRVNNEITHQNQDNTLPEIHKVKEEFVSDDEDNDITEKHLDPAENVTVKKEIEISVIEGQEVDAEMKDVTTDAKSYNEANSDQTDRPRYACDHCSKSYLMKCHLQRHMKIHRVVNGLPTKSYNCETCGKSFVQKCTLKRHVLVHNDDKKFCCDLCPTRCRQKNDMERHMLTHTGHKPFACPVCKQKYSRKSNMKLHLLTHDNNKPFVCDICQATFSRKYDLRRHTNRKHLGAKSKKGKNYKCEICDFRSVNASYIKKHMDNKHGRR